MHGRKLFSTGPVAVILTTVALIGGCREATTGPSDPNSSSFASAMQVIAGNAQFGQIGSALSQQLTVKVVDAGGLPVQGAAVTFTARTGGGSIIPPTGTSNAAGLVTATWTLGTALGAQTAVAKLTSSFVSDSSNFTATATGGPAGIIALVSGNNQSSLVGQLLALPLVVKVTDAYGNKISGAKVTWTPGNLSGTASPPSDTTDTTGSASAAWTLGNTATAQTLSASVAGLPPVVFSATASADTAHVIFTTVSLPIQPASVSSAVPTLSVRVTDILGNPIVGDVVTWDGLITGGGSVTTSTSVTDATGTATNTWTLGGRAGSQTLQAREASKGFTVNFAATATISFSDVFAGNFMACGIVATNNQLYCWGVGDGGQLGRGPSTNASAPTTPVSTTSDTSKGPFLQIRQLSGGNDGFCALTIDRRLFCWGRTIGVSAVSTPIATAQPIVTGSTNQQILPNFITMGEQHVCLLDLTGLGFCTGTNLHAELGTGNDTTPQLGTYPFINVPPSLSWAKIAAGQAHTCAIPRFNPLDATSQTPRCWGLNTSGQVGNNHTSTSNGQLNPTVITPLPAGTKFDSSTITAGAQHSCAIEAVGSVTQGQAWCWGGNGFGQLGSGTVGASIDSVPTPAAVGLVFAKIYAGTFHTCAISTGGAAYCWGRNDYGQLGGGSTSAGTATPTPVAGSLAFRSLSIGELYTCGVTGNVLTDPSGPSAPKGTVYCWGDNLFGQIGNGTTANNAPVLVPSKVLYQP